jgi:hypothetical protein
MKLRLQANSSGALNSIRLNARSFENFGQLHRYIIGLVGDQKGPGSIRDTAEVELDCDYNLNYVHVIDAISAISGRLVSAGGHDDIEPLVEKIKFSPLKKAPSG